MEASALFTSSDFLIITCIMILEVLCSELVENVLQSQCIEWSWIKNLNLK